MSCDSPPRPPPLQHISEVLLHCDLESTSSAESSRPPDPNELGSARRGDGSGSDLSPKGWSSWQDLVKAGQQSLLEAQREILERVEQDVRGSSLGNGELAAQLQGTVFEPMANSMAAAVADFLQVDRAELETDRRKDREGTQGFPMIHTYEPSCEAVPGKLEAYAKSLPKANPDRRVEVHESTGFPTRVSRQSSNSQGSMTTDAASVEEITEEDTRVSLLVVSEPEGLKTGTRQPSKSGSSEELTDKLPSVAGFMSHEYAPTEKNSNALMPLPVARSSKEPKKDTSQMSVGFVTSRPEESADCKTDAERNISRPSNAVVSGRFKSISFGEDCADTEADEEGKHQSLSSKSPAARLHSMASYSTSASVDLEAVTRIHSLSSFNAASVLADITLDSSLQRDRMADLNRVISERNEVIELESAAGNEQQPIDPKPIEPESALPLPSSSCACSLLGKSVMSCFPEQVTPDDPYQEIHVDTARLGRGEVVEHQLPVVQMHSSSALPPAAGATPGPKVGQCQSSDFCLCPACCSFATVGQEEYAEGMDRQPRHRAATILPPLIAEEVVTGCDMISCKLPTPVCRPFAFACGGC
eukprot:TRINITY_DN104467_c0_g1_i1.p1 TRINITY_DN104467_c0_g1~~TRINITY_DN104467_c0_g1_i1.p1  ORF type:complete len:587 (+),score=109.95 TRINITY_DN104467_c0_g1_i1:40-1800(+)